jgi:hypothetical protein
MRTFDLKTQTFKFLGVLTLAAGFLIATSQPAQAQTRQWTASGSICVSGPNNDVATIGGVQCLVANLLGIAIPAIALGSFVMLLIGSFKYLLSGGNAKGADTARLTITFAVVGLVVALSGFIILNLLVRFTGVNEINTFRVPTFESTQ